MKLSWAIPGYENTTPPLTGENPSSSLPNAPHPAHYPYPRSGSLEIIHRQPSKPNDAVIKKI